MAGELLEYMLFLRFDNKNIYDAILGQYEVCGILKYDRAVVIQNKSSHGEYFTSCPIKKKWPTFHTHPYEYSMLFNGFPSSIDFNSVVESFDGTNISDDYVISLMGVVRYGIKKMPVAKIEADEINFFLHQKYSSSTKITKLISEFSRLLTEKYGSDVIILEFIVDL